jgi:PucR family transcriptional regulator, purine catabolism regulatory protein
LDFLNFTSILKIQDVLKRPLFQKAQVIAGEAGLNRHIRWVHILEVENFETMIHGDELILSTGIGLKKDVLSPTIFLEKLIKLNASCLCIEIGDYFTSIPQEMIDLANKHHFPLIIFPDKVLFVDITQDLHSYLINRNHKLLQNLEKLSREFQRSTLTSQGTLDVLRLLQKNINAQLIYHPSHGQPIMIPANSNDSQQDKLDFIQSTIRDLSADPLLTPLQYDENYVFLQPIEVMGQKWAYIAVFFPHEPNEYISLILDAAAISIAQCLLRMHYIGERRHHTENVWVHDLVLQRTYNERLIRSHIGQNYQRYNEANFQVCYIEINNLSDVERETTEDMFESTQYHISLMVRSAFEQFGFYPLIHLDNNQIVVIALEIEAKALSKNRLKEVFKCIGKINLGYSKNEICFHAGIGQTYVGLKNAYLSYQEARKAILLCPFYDKSIIYFDEMGVFQLLVNLNDESTLRSYVSRHLGSLIEKDHNNELLYTLNTFLENNCSKQITAKKLYIVRQSLYYRLEKIKELLGEDWTSAENQLALKVALVGYKLLFPDHFCKCKQLVNSETL